MKKAVIIGGGGHAKVIIDILRSRSEYQIIGCTDTGSNSNVLGVNIVGDDSILPELFAADVKYAIVALGENKLRDRLFHKFKAIGFELINAISPFSYISEYARLGQGIAVMPGAVINADAEIGDNVIVNTGASIDHDCRIQQSCHIAPGVNIAGSVTIGEGTFAGIGAKVIDGVTVGEWSTLGAGTVIVNDIPNHSLVVGVPGKVIRSLK